MHQPSPLIHLGGKMLSYRTLGPLEGLSCASTVIYPEGGLLFTFRLAHRQAHSLLSKSLQEALFTGNTQKYAASSAHDISELARFVQAALGDYIAKEVSRPATDTAIALIDSLKEDLRYDLFLD